jgi:Galactose oxidase, central domain
MAQRALGAGMIVPRKRAMFGLLDADGWAWAGVKAFVWLVIILLLLGYIPDRAYYLTVNRTVELGVLAWSPINLCPPENESLPCPPPVGALAPWHESPTELALPAPRTGGAATQLGTKLLYIGGSDGSAAQSTVYVAQLSGVGNFDKWAEGPALPEPRSDASVVQVSGTVYVLGGLDADGQPTTTVYSLTPDPKTGALPEWETASEELTLPEARSGAAGVAAADGMLLIGGEGPDGPVATTWKSPFDAQGALQEWETEAPLIAPQADATAAIVGDHVWLYGGHDANGPVATVQRGDLGLEAAEGFPANPDEGKVVVWAVNPAANLPAPRDDATGWAANGSLYLVGGKSAEGPQRETYWSIPTNAGDIPEWKRLGVSDLPVGVAGGTVIVTGPNAIIVGGEAAQGGQAAAPAATSLRANTAPQSPFFQVGLVGATVPGLKIDGEIGQQLGYLNAAGAGTVNFVILLLVGWAFAHRERARAILGRVIRRRRR